MFEAVTVVAGFDNVTVVSEAIQKSGGHFRIAEDVGPLGEAQIGISYLELGLVLACAAVIRQSEKPMAIDSISYESIREHFPITAAHRDAKRWIQSCVMLGLAANTVTAYARAVEGFLGFCQNRSVEVRSASREVIAQYVGELRTLPRRERSNVVRIDSGALLSNATLQQRLTAVRLFFDFSCGY